MYFDIENVVNDVTITKKHSLYLFIIIILPTKWYIENTSTTLKVLGSNAGMDVKLSAFS